MTFPVSFRPEVRDELRDVFIWYQQQQSGLGWAFSLCIEEAIDRIRDHPEAFPTVHREMRRAPVRRFPFGVYFVFSSKRILIVAVFHASRHPQGWMDRLPE